MRLFCGSIIMYRKIINSQDFSAADLVRLYQNWVGNYPKFFKMDLFSRLAFIASEMVLQDEADTENVQRFQERDDRAVVLCTRSASILTDRRYLETMPTAPSPALFAYTLPNVATGEIAIRNHYLGETMTYILQNDTQVEMLMRQTLVNSTKSVLGGWIEVTDETHFIVDLQIWKN